MRRIGLNIGAPNEYMSPYQAELIPPGYFQPRHYRTCIPVQTIRNEVIVLQDFYSVDWQNPDQPVGFWNNATWVNPLTGETGLIKSFDYIEGRYAYTLDRPTSLGSTLWAIMEKPYRSLWQKKAYPHIPLFSLWYDAYKVQTNKNALDAIDLNGPWLLSGEFASPGGCVLRLTISRQDGTILVDYKFNVNAGTTHQQFGTDINISNDTRNRMLGIGLYMEGGESVDVKSLSMKRADAVCGLHPKAFQAIERFKPGVLRYWQEQFGNSVLGMYTGAFHAYKPTDLSAGRKELPLTHFLDLCEAIDCKSWVCSPTVLFPEEFDILIDDPRIDYVEYGNESWGDRNGYSDPFAGASLGFDYPKVAERFARRSNSGKFILNGHTNVSFSDSMMSQCPSAKVQSVAPYYGIDGSYSNLDKYSRFWTYEVNSHANVNSAFEFNAGMQNACALAMQILKKDAAEPDTMKSYTCVFTAFQYREKENVPLWGVIRDTVTYLPRPTYYVCQMLNKVLPANLNVVENNVWQSDTGWIIMVNESGESIPLQHAYRLLGATYLTGNVEDNNETEAKLLPVYVADELTVTEIRPWTVLVGPLNTEPDLPVQETMEVNVPANIRKLILTIE